MKKLFVFVLAFLVVLFTSSFVLAVDKQLIFEWSHDTPSDLAGFKLHYGNTSPRVYDQVKDLPLGGELNQNCTPPTIEGSTGYCYVLTLPVADTGLFTYYFTATAYDTGGLPSEYSNEVNMTYDFEVPPAVSDLSATFDETTKLLSFKWNYVTAWLPKIEKWSLWESDTIGGPYNKVVDIPYDSNTAPPYSTDVQVQVPTGSKVTKYYVLVTHRPSVNNYVFSPNSNEVKVTIDQMPPTSPFELKVKVKN